MEYIVVCQRVHGGSVVSSSDSQLFCVKCAHMYFCAILGYLQKLACVGELVIRNIELTWD